MKLAFFLDHNSLIHHHGVRRLILSMFSMLEQRNHKVEIILSLDNRSDHFHKFMPDKRLLFDNFFNGNIVVGNSRQEIIDKLKNGQLYYVYDSPDFSHIISRLEKVPDNEHYELVILAGPWVYVPERRLPKASAYKCIAHDCIPIKYYFDMPNNHPFRHSANMHNRGYIWAQEKADGIISNSTSTMNDLK